ncbi:MAG: efflux RND transporter periplasmic adaptor subunit [Anaerolineae bacterium]|nr:efflux RND transporter periplasmic adaptor subunit [Anaerolineae bacterium]
MSVRRSLIILTILTLLLSVGMAFLLADEDARAETSREETLAAMQTYTVQQGTVLITIPATGTMKAREVSNLSFLASGQVDQILVQEGDYVEAGAPLVELKNRSQVITYEQANLNYEAAVRKYEDLLVVDENDIEIAEANLNSARGSYTSVADSVSDETIAAAELQYEQAQIALQAAQRARNEANPDLDEAAVTLMDARIGEASFNAEIARLRLEDLRSANQGELGAAGARIAQAERQLEQVRAGASEYDVEQAQVAIDQAEAQLDQAKLSYDRTILTAPFAGTVATINLEPGQRISAGVPVVQLVDVTPMHLSGEIDELDLRQVSVGQPAQVELDALPNITLDATVSFLSSSGNTENGLVRYAIELELDASDERIRPGMTAEASIIVEQVPDVIVVPNRYVLQDQEQGTLYVDILMSDGTVLSRTVTIGTRGDDYTEILSGLQPGETVAFMPQQRRSGLGLFGG